MQIKIDFIPLILSLNIFYEIEYNFQLLQFFLSLLGIISGLMVVGLKNPVHAVFSLIITFCVSSMLLLTVLCDFLAIIFVVVYVGAIAVLFLFVVMMLNIKFVQFTESVLRYLPFSFIIFLIFLNEFYFGKITLDNQNNFKIDWVNYFFNSETIFLLAEVLYINYLHIFLIAGIILLLAMIGTINLTLYHAHNVKRQQIYKQLGRTVLFSISLKNEKGN